MSIAVPIILFILMAGVCIFMDIRGWKDFRHLYWLISVITGFVPYGRYSIVCAMFAFFLLGLMVFAIVFWIGRYMINKEENPYFRG